MTSNERSTDRWERLRPRNWSLAFKLIAVLVVPVLIAQALLVLRIIEQVNAADRLGGNERYITAQEHYSTVADQLQAERDQSVKFVAAGRAGDRAALKTTVFDATDTSVSEARTAAGDPASLGDAAEPYRGAQDALGKLAAVRAQVTDSQAPVIDVVNQYTATIAPVIRLETALARQLRLAESTNLPTVLEALCTAREQIALQHAVIAGAIIRKAMTPAEVDLVRAADVRLAATVDELNGTLDADQRARFAGFLATPDNAKRDQLKNAVLTRFTATQDSGTGTGTGNGTATGAVPPLPALADWDAAYPGVLTAHGGAEKAVRDDLRAINAAQQENAKNLAGIYSVILLLATVLGTTLLVVVWRTLLKSLRTLRGTALDVAQRKLPQALQSMRQGEVPEISVEPVPVTTSEEIGQVARAFDAVHSQAVRLAAEQATLQAGVSSMFVNLSRRSQGLVERQLQLIEQLESNEQDPDQLANLFQLDHLATRMRRNSESLLVLAGSEANRRAGQPVPVIDVLRAAVSEVEQYQRVVVQPPPPVKILGRTAADLVHLLAELLDNATNFSAPDTQVVMSSTRTEDGSVLIEIADRGVGMAPNELAEANDRLSGPTTVDVSASRRMGLFVVGRLASRHGIGVRLDGPPAGTSAAGVTASVSVPSYLVPVVEGAGTGIDEGARVGAGAPGQEMAANGASTPGSLQALVASGNSRPSVPNGTPNGVSNGQGADARPDLPPQRAPMDRPLAPPRLGPPLAPADQNRSVPAGTPRGGPAAPAAPMTGRATDTSAPRSDGPRPDMPRSDGPRPDLSRPEMPRWNGPRPDLSRPDLSRPDTPRPEHEPTSGRPMFGGPPPGAPDLGVRSANDAAAPPVQQPGLPPRSMPPRGALFAPIVPAMAEPPATPEPPGAAPSMAATPVAPPPSQAPPAPALPRRSPEATVTERRDLSETTPIFEEIASAWFQSNRPVPVDWDTADDEGGAGEPAARAEAPTGEQQDVEHDDVEHDDVEHDDVDAGQETPREPQPAQAAPMLDPRLRVTSAMRSYTPTPPAGQRGVPQEQRPAAEPERAPEVTQRPQGPHTEATEEPEHTAEPEHPAEPEHTAEPGHVAEPEHTTEPEHVAEPEHTAEPEHVAERQAEHQPVAERQPEPDVAEQPEPEPAPPAPQPLPQRQPTRPAVQQQPAAPLPRVEQEPAAPAREPVAAAPSSTEFATAADAGWQAAQALEGSGDEPEELTSAGLPKRRPRARLIPGSAAAASSTQAGAPPRTADAVRGRLASYQEGVRQGREQRLRHGPDPAGATTGGRSSEGHDEENR